MAIRVFNKGEKEIQFRGKDKQPQAVRPKDTVEIEDHLEAERILNMYPQDLVNLGGTTDEAQIARQESQQLAMAAAQERLAKSQESQGDELVNLPEDTKGEVQESEDEEEGDEEKSGRKGRKHR